MKLKLEKKKRDEWEEERKKQNDLKPSSNLIYLWKGNKEPETILFIHIHIYIYIPI